jgi:Fe2+ or Zn2+ uptake regulation protein
MPDAPEPISPPALSEQAEPISLGRIAELLERGGQRLTPARRAIAEAVVAQRRPFTSEQIVAACPGVGRASVYRMLELLLSLGAVARVVRSDGRSMYITSAPGHWHYLICVDCGRTVPFAACPVRDLAKRLEVESGYEIEGHLLEMFGICPGCRVEAE